MTIGTISRLTIASGQHRRFEGLFRNLKAHVHAHVPGALFYGLARTGADTYAVFEFYADQASLDAHRAADYFKAAMADVTSCLAGPPETEYLDIVA